MRLGGPARYLIEAHAVEDIEQALQWARQEGVAVIVIGEGSNIVWQDGGFNGLVIVNKILGKTITGPNKGTYELSVGAGESWDETVAFAVEHNLSGIETLSLIPGKTGAAPVQNIGAYGTEVGETIAWVDTIEVATGEHHRFTAKECAFAYRKSRFNSEDAHAYAITAVGLNLRNADSIRQGHAIALPFYKDVAAYLEEHDITKPTPADIRAAVIAIRRAKLPDPAKLANNGSFFKNPMITQEHFNQLAQEFPDMPHWVTKHGSVKLAAGWLIEAAGFKGFKDKSTGMAVWPKQALVLVNVVAKNTNDLLTFKDKICQRVFDKFGVTLEQEPELLGSAEPYSS